MSTQNLSKTVEAALTAAVALIEKRYGTGASNENELAFHGVRHTNGVVARAVSLITAMEASEEDITLAGIAAAFHDTVQNWEEFARPDGAIMRKRFAGQNERDSAAEAIAWMRETGIYSEHRAALVTEAILATVPGWNVDHKTVVQPNLRPDSHPVVRAVALADLGTGGMEGETFVTEGDPLFREENLDIARAIGSARSQSDITEEAQQRYRGRMLAWTQSQSTFVSGRKALLETELGNLGDSLKEPTRQLFRGFDDAITASALLVATRSTLSFWEMAQAMGYNIPTV